ncbi:MAG TPA: pyridoxamine 5'-phosphate oxidase family protein [Caproiciproducens sp.]|nr:pyridoxamine 5'-phosphate oxidase family protein [Caproiciproducens sp.]
MRRTKQLLSEEEAVEILNRCSTGILGVNGDDGYPYTVPINYFYKDGSIFLHCAKDGHKTDSIKRDDKVTFCIVEPDEVIQKTFSTHYCSVEIFGRARILTEDSEKQAALEDLVKKYSPDYIKEGQQEIEDGFNRVCIVEIKIEHMTGKVSLDIAKSRQ